MSSILILLLEQVCGAAPPSGESAAPVAVPQEAPPPARILPGHPAARSRLPGPARDAALAEAIRGYRERELTLAEITRSSIDYGYTYVVFDPYWGPTPWVQPAVSPRRELVVLQGEAPLDVPQTLGALGDLDARDDLLQQIRRKQRASRLGFVVGLGGMVAASVGLAQMDQATDSREFTTWSQVTAGGVGALVAGFVGGAIPSSRAHRLQHDVEATFELPTLEREIEEHNAALAKQLGLSRAEVARIERLSRPD
jgi:hypothetical protein